MSPLLALLTAAAALAQSEATLISGQSLLQDCLEDPDCGPALVGLLSENMAEYGFTQQADPIATSALGGKGVGTVVELRIDTVTLGPRNELEQLVFVPPGLPRIAVGYQYGSYTYDNPYPQLAAGITVLPPVRVLGGTLAGLQVDGSAAVPVLEHLVWVGGGVGYGYGQLVLPLLGSQRELRQIPSLSEWVPDESPTRCPSLEEGCLDAFRQHAGHLRAGVSLEPVPALFAYARAAGVALVQRLRIAYDDTRWGSGGVQGQLQLGAGFRAGDTYQAALGAALASRPEALSTAGERAMLKLVFSTSFRFGARRYWERDLPPEEREEEPS